MDGFQRECSRMGRFFGPSLYRDGFLRSALMPWIADDGQHAFGCEHRGGSGERDERARRLRGDGFVATREISEVKDDGAQATLGGGWQETEKLGMVSAHKGNSIAQSGVFEPCAGGVEGDRLTVDSPDSAVWADGLGQADRVISIARRCIEGPVARAEVLNEALMAALGNRLEGHNDVKRIEGYGCTGTAGSIIFGGDVETKEKAKRCGSSEVVLRFCADLFDLLFLGVPGWIG